MKLLQSIMISLTLFAFLNACGAGSSESKLKQETDDRPTPESMQLVDVSEYWNAFVQEQYSEALQEVNSDDKEWTPTLRLALVKNLGTRLGASRVGSGLGVHLGALNIEISKLSELEIFLRDHLQAEAKQIRFLNFADTRYADNALGLPGAQVLSHISRTTADHSISPVIRIGSTLIGLDKVGHFASQGLWYFLAEQEGLLSSQDERRKFGEFMEGSPELARSEYGTYRAVYARYCKPCMILGGFGYFGMTSTGVASRADMEANEDGYRFYRDLFEHPSTFSFDAQKYVTPLWNEAINPNIYKKGLKLRP